MLFVPGTKLDKQKRILARKLIRENAYEEFHWLLTTFMELITPYKFRYQNSWESLFDSIIHINERYVDEANMVCNHI